MIRKINLFRPALLAAVLLLASCLFDSSSEKAKDNKNQPSPNDFYNIFYPAQNYGFKMDTAFTIQWYRTSAVKDSVVSLYLYNGDEQVLVMVESILDKGVFSWYVPSDLGSGTQYRIRIVNDADTSQSDFSEYFRIYSIYSGSIAVLAPAAGADITMGNSFIIRWTTTGDIGSRVSIHLYYGDSLVTDIDGSEINDGEYTWFSPGSGLGSGDRYRIKVASTADVGLKSWSGYFAMVSQYSGSFSFTLPESGTSVKTGESLAVEWASTGNPGNYAELSLYKDSAYIMDISTYESLSGSLTWSLSAELATGSAYQIRVSSMEDPGIYTFSRKFTVEGLAEDVHEPDTVRSQGLTVSLDSLYLRTLSFGDTDWFKFSADSGKTYIFRDSGTQMNKYLYKGSAANYTQYFSYSSRLNVWTCDAAGTYYVKLEPRSGYFGEYVFRISRLAPAKVLNITRPQTGAVWDAGSTYNIRWTPDSLLFGNYVHFYLTVDTGQVLTISTSYNSNSGTFSWTIPGGIVTDSSYRIRITSSENEGIYGHSGTFTINGLPPDEFEPDAERSQGVAAEEGTAYARTLTQNDEDWFQFTADSGRTYVFQDTGEVQVYKYLYKGQADNYIQNYSYTSNVQTWTCTESGTYYIRISPPSSSYYGAYTFKFDRLRPGQMLEWTNPVSGTTWAAGTAYEIQWTPDISLFGDYIELYLDQDTGQAAVIRSTTTPNSGSYSWSVPQGLLTSDSYQIRLVNRSNRDIYALSPLFTISGVTPDSFEPDNTEETAKNVPASGTAQARSLSLNDQDWAKFRAQPGWMYIIRTSSGNSLSTVLYHDGSLLENDFGTENQIILSEADTGLYYVNISSTSAYGEYTLRVNGYDPADVLSFSSPVGSSTWSSGTAQEILWEPDSVLFGNYVDILLVLGDETVISLGSSRPNSGSFSWSVPAGLATASGYRIRIEHYTDSRIAGFSEAFTIAGIIPDSDEPDDSLSQAKPIATGGVSERHSITYRNEDWFSFAAVQNTLYEVAAAGGSGLTLTLFSSTGTTQLATGQQAFADSSVRILKFIAAAGTYYFRVNGSYTGDYTAAVIAYAEGAYGLNISSPSLAASYSAGDTLTISWGSQVDVGGDVDIFLYTTSGGLPVRNVTTSPTANDGVFTWVIPAALPAGADYFIKIISRVDAHILGDSDEFAVTVP